MLRGRSRTRSCFRGLGGPGGRRRAASGDEVRQERAEVDQDVQDGRAVQIAAALDVYDAEDDPGRGMGNDIDGLGQRQRVHMNHSEQDAGGDDRDPGPGITPDKVDEEPPEEHLLDDGAHNAEDRQFL